MLLRIPACSVLRCLISLLILLTLNHSASARTLRSRPLHLKPTNTFLRQGHDPRRVVVKFGDGTDVRLRSGGLQGRGAFRSDQLTLVLSRFGVSRNRVRRLFTRSEEELDVERAEGERRSRRQLADLNLYYELDLPQGADAAALCDELNSLPFVEVAEPALLPAPLPVDLAPPTPRFVVSQGYRSAPPLGVGIDRVGAIPGADGSGVRVADIEYSWVLDHEDLELGPAAMIDTGTPLDPYNDLGNHGTAVLGEMVGVANEYGITGLAPAAEALVAAANTVEHGYQLPRAVNLAAAALVAGDVILIEQQTWVCAGGAVGFGPVEWNPAVFDAIESATALGIVVVEAAGNGNVNLDSPECEGRFDRSVRDSGAIIVGAGEPATGRRLGFSSYGSRVDVQGWGNGVMTSGYGDAFDPGDSRQRYTRNFSGTSSASPVVAGAALSIQGAVIAAGLPPLDPEELRSTLTQTGTPQDPWDLSGAIGPLPDVPEALAVCTSGRPTPWVSLPEGFRVGAFLPVALNLSLRACGHIELGATLTIETPEGLLAAYDDGVAPDQAAGDGVHSVVWTPTNPGAVTLIVEGWANGVPASRSMFGHVLPPPVLVGSLDTLEAWDVSVSGLLAFVADAASGLQVIDVSSPTAPVLLGSLDSPSQEFGVSVSASRAFVATSGSGLQVIDVSNPAAPALLGRADTAGLAVGVAVSGSLAFVADGDSGMQVIDVLNPITPVVVGSVDTPGFAEDVAVSGSLAFVADASSGLQVIDVSNPTAPVLVGNVNTPDAALSVSASGSLTFVASGVSGLQVIDVSNPTAPVVVGSVDTPGFAHDVAVSGLRAFVGDGSSGLQVIDLSDPRAPVLLGSADTPGWALGVSVSGSLAFVADASSGMHVIDVSMGMAQCSNGLDDDGDGNTDHPDDPGCAGPSFVKESPQCNDGLDNDGDTLIDHPADPGCAGFSSNDRESPPATCGLVGVEGLALLGILAGLGRARRTCRTDS